MSRLTTRQREIWQYFNEDGATPIEIAEQLGINEKVVREHIKAAIKNINRDEYGEAGYVLVDPHYLDNVIAYKDEDGTWCEVKPGRSGSGHRRIDNVNHG